MNRVCIFVDGENFRHTIKKVFSSDEFDSREYLPKLANWTDFYDWLAKKASPDQGHRFRCYWYVLEHVDFYPFKFPDPEKEADSLRILLGKDERFQGAIKGFKDSGDVSGEIKWLSEKSNELKKVQQAFLSRFRGWHVLQDGIANRHRAIEFRRAGATTFNLFTGRLGQEKAVDVMLATDMIVLKDIYDTAVLVSGDQDYVPAVKRIKDAGKTVVNVAFKTRDGKLLPGGARRLNNLTDSSIELDHTDLLSFLCPKPTLEKVNTGAKHRNRS